MLRTVYECGVFQTLREQLRCKEIWVVGADRWRNPDEDLPADFADKRVENYRKLNQPLDPEEFIARPRGDMVTELSGLNDALPRLGWVDNAERKAGAIGLSPLEARAEPRNPRRLKKAVRAKWGVVPLLDMLKETALRTGMLEVGRAEKTAFCARYLRDRDLQYEVGPGLNVVENSHGIHGETLYGKTGELSSNRREEQELTMLALHVLQACLVYVNTLMLQEVLAEPGWGDALTAEDRRGLTPLFSSNMNSCGDIRLNTGNRLALGG
ncbi:Tn3 family transposase [Nocardiopsis dassonvillei]